MAKAASANRPNKKRLALGLLLVVAGIAGAVAFPRFTVYDDPGQSVHWAAADTVFAEKPGKIVEADAPPVIPGAGNPALHREAHPNGVDVDITREAETANENGDLSLDLAVPSATFIHGTPIRANVTLRNLSLANLHIPAAGEPQPTLVVTVFDSEGAEVRRIVETTEDPIPRRTRRLEPNGTMALSILLVAHGEEPLTPGAYRCVARYDAHPSWRRIGLPTWTAPNGSLRSTSVTFDVTPAESDDSNADESADDAETASDDT